jgi:crotonobetainyl-CoA:carnitine CoA-transferase CaiB-like acyl-CoA transferase
MGLFSDLLVIDCASYIAGPAAATILSDFGARVIKIEPPGEGDSYRRLIRLLDGDPDTNYFWMLDSRNKESLALDLKQPAAQSALRSLIARADVFITNFPGPIRERLGIAAADILRQNPAIIYASMTPYGESGPERDRTAYDTTAYWARSGLMDAVRPDPQSEPSATVPGMGDHPTSVSLFAAIVTALYRRQRTGRGGEVSTSLMANGLWSNAAHTQAALCGVTPRERRPRGSRNPLSEAYRTSDGRQIMLVVVNHEREFPLLLEALGRQSWSSDPRFSDHAARIDNAAALVTELDAAFARRPLAEWRARLTEAGVTFGVIAEAADHASDEQMLANGMLPLFEDGGGLRTVDSPIRLADETKTPPRMAPDIGRHTRAILREFGSTDHEIEALIASGAAAAAD